MTVLSTSRWLPAPPATVFAAFVDPQRLARWWGPAGFANTFDVCDVRPGGEWRFTMHGPDGAAYPNESRFTRVEPPHCLSIRHTCAPHFELTLTLTPEGDGTRLQWDQAFDDPAVAEQLRNICEPANEQNLDRLAAELASAPRRITTEARVPASIERVWQAWTTPADICAWNAALDSWHCPAATLDLRPGGTFSYRMAARDGSMAFDFAGTFTHVVPQRLIEYTLGDGRQVRVEFLDEGKAVRVRQSFDTENEHSAQQQRQGWQAILERFARHAAMG